MMDSIAAGFPRETLPLQFDFSTALIARLTTHNRRLAEAKKQFPSATMSLRRAA
jgi:hypothetical protein